MNDFNKLSQEEKDKYVEEIMDRMIPSRKKLRELEENFKKTPAYAWQQILLMEKHLKENPEWENDNKHCSKPECKELTSRENNKKHLDTLRKDIIDHQEDIEGDH